MKILKLLLSLITLSFMWFFAVAFLPYKISVFIFCGGIISFPFILVRLMKIFGLKFHNSNCSNCDFDDPDYGDAHYDPAYSMMSGNIYNSDD